jgi:hypothetical protein
MPIPLLVWAGVAVVGGILAWKGDEIQNYLENDEDGKELKKSLVSAAKTTMSASFDPEVRQRMERHVETFFSQSPEMAIIGWPLYISKLDTDELRLIATYCSIEAGREISAGNAERGSRLQSLAVSCRNATLR